MTKKVVAITGANGILGQAIIRLLKKEAFDILILHHDIDEIRERLIDCRDKVYAVIHCAFARNEDGRQLSSSLSLTKDLMELINQLKILRIINISSKSVYESQPRVNWNEQTSVAPKGGYGLAKYAAELIADMAITNSECKLVHVRLASLIGPGMEERVVTKFVKKVFNGQDITITNGAQKFQYMDIRDAAQAVVALLNADAETWKRIYCVAPAGQVTLQDMAQLVVDACLEEGIAPVKITIIDEGHDDSGCMDARLFCKDTGWKEEYTLRDSVQSIISQCKGQK